MVNRAIGAAVVTIPSVIYLLQPDPNKDHGHGHDEGEHKDHEDADDGEEKTGEGEDSETQRPEGGAEGGEQASDGDSDSSEDGDKSTSAGPEEPPRPDHTVYDAGQGTPETSSDEDPKAGAHEVDSGGNVEGVRFKGATSGGTREGEQGDTRKHIPDAKGGNKKRIESDYGKPQGVFQGEDKDASKGASNVHSGEQEGLSNTDTKHSTDMDNNPDKSKKGEGFVETAKMKGPVDPGRPQAENRPGKENATDYLAYVTNDAENLQFYLWLVNYHQRFGNAPPKETALSPKWNFDDPQFSPRDSGNSAHSAVGGSDKTLSILGVKDFDAIVEEDISNASVFEDHPSPYMTTLGTLKFSEIPLTDCRPLESSTRRSNNCQPFRVEINRIVTHYRALGSPRELNLSHKDRAAVLYALRHTTHPSAFQPVKQVLDMTLRSQSHPNFIRWSICNGNKPWTMFLRTFAVFNIALGFAIAILLTLSRASRWYRILAALEWWFGISNLIAAYQGICILLLRRHTREIRPWEMDEQGPRHDCDDQEAVMRRSKVLYEETKSRWPVKMELFGPPNTWDNETWMDRYNMKSIFGKTFEKEVPTQDGGLRTMQNKIVRQAEAWALIITVPLTILFTALPKGNLY
ncbi:MAG: hypothetical protein Q9225_005199 [Loekoesia sp. 1 TL-2023]